MGSGGRGSVSGSGRTASGSASHDNNLHASSDLASGAGCTEDLGSSSTGICVVGVNATDGVVVTGDRVVLTGAALADAATSNSLLSSREHAETAAAVAKQHTATSVVRLIVLIVVNPLVLVWDPAWHPVLALRDVVGCAHIPFVPWRRCQALSTNHGKGACAGV